MLSEVSQSQGDKDYMILAIRDTRAVKFREKEKTSSASILLTTGADDSFAAKNIYDVLKY